MLSIQSWDFMQLEGKAIHNFVFLRLHSLLLPVTITVTLEGTQLPKQGYFVLWDVLENPLSTRTRLTGEELIPGNPVHAQLTSICATDLSPIYTLLELNPVPPHSKPTDPDKSMNPCPHSWWWQSVNSKLLEGKKFCPRTEILQILNLNAP